MEGLTDGAEERKKTVWVFPAVIAAVMEWSRTASAVCCSTPSLAILQRQSGRLRKHLGETTQAPFAYGWSQIHILPPQSGSAVSAFATVLKETERNMLTQFTVTVEGSN